MGGPIDNGNIVASGVCLEAALEEWHRTHRSILLQGQRLTVEQNCPVIIYLLEDAYVLMYTICM